MNTYFIVGFRPLSRYIGLYHEVIVKEVKEKKQRFRPLSRYIGLYQGMSVWHSAKSTSFRPLSRYIGLYLDEGELNQWKKQPFPSPLEVYRFISNFQLAFSKSRN